MWPLCCCLRPVLAYGAVVTYAVNAIHLPSALPMALVMTLCTWVALAAYWLLVRPNLPRPEQ